jgi:hypothetical protein
MATQPSTIPFSRVKGALRREFKDTLEEWVKDCVAGDDSDDYNYYQHDYLIKVGGEGKVECGAFRMQLQDKGALMFGLWVSYSEYLGQWETFTFNPDVISERDQRAYVRDLTEEALEYFEDLLATHDVQLLDPAKVKEEGSRCACWGCKDE